MHGYAALVPKSDPGFDEPVVGLAAQCQVPFPEVFRAFAGRALTWWPEFGVGYYPAEGARYDDAYYRKYVEYAATGLGHRLTTARVEFVARHWAGGVVDVGIGCGAFVASRPRTLGYDINPLGVAWLRAANRFADPYLGCDAITLWDVLEHIADFEKLLAGVRKCVFVSLPVFTDAEHVLRSRHFRRDEHFWYFTTEGLVAVMDSLGWKCEETNREETTLGRDSIGSFAFRRL